MLERTLKLTSALSLPRTLGPLQYGKADPCTRVFESHAWRATNTPEGPATVLIELKSQEVRLQSWGKGSRWLLDQGSELLGLNQPGPSIKCKHQLIDELSRAKPGMRIPRTSAVFESCIPTILGQRVTAMEAKFSYKKIVSLLGEPAPGPHCLGLMLPPLPERVADTPTWVLHPYGVESKRAKTLQVAARAAKRLEETTAMDPKSAMARLLAVPGIGPWSAAEIAYTSLGNGDAVSVGDFHIKNYVSWALAKEPRGTDERMMELLEPFAPYRGWVSRLIMNSGIQAPRFGPRYKPLPIARF